MKSRTRRRMSDDELKREIVRHFLAIEELKPLFEAYMRRKYGKR